MPNRLPIIALVLATTIACASGRGVAAYDAANRAAASTLSCRGSTDLRGPVGATNALPRIGEEVARAEICVMMDRGAAAWNRGDLETFVDDYTDSATYVGSR